MSRRPFPSAVLPACILSAFFGSSASGDDNRPTARTIEGSWTTAVAWTADGTRLVAAAGDRSLVVYRADDLAELRRIDDLPSVATAVVCLGDGRIVTGHWDGSVELRDADGKLQSRRNAHRESVLTLAPSADGRRIASGGADDRLRVWNVADGSLVFELPTENEYDVTAVAWSADDRYLVAGDGDNHATVYDARTGDRLLDLVGHTEAIAACSFSPDGRRMLTGSWDGTLRLWDADTGRELRAIESRGGDVSVAALLPDGRRIVAGTDDGAVRLWDGETGALLATIARGDARILCLAIDRDGLRAAMGGRGPLRVVPLPE